jgi:hypothetical protein
MSSKSVSLTDSVSELYGQTLQLIYYIHHLIPFNLLHPLFLLSFKGDTRSFSASCLLERAELRTLEGIMKFISYSCHYELYTVIKTDEIMRTVCKNSDTLLNSFNLSLIMRVNINFLIVGVISQCYIL